MIICVASAGFACDDEDVGEPCGDLSTSVGAQPIEDEKPVTEVIRLESDRACETFQCISHSGLSPYCTKSCALDSSVTLGSCANDRDCDPLFGDPTGNTICVDGQCIDDDCPEGFVCRPLQTVGTLAGERVCVRKSGCQNNLDCEDLGAFECRQLGCIDSCFLEARDEDNDPTGTTVCEDDDVNALVCKPLNELPCTCIGGATSCEDAALQCGPTDALFPEGTVAQQGICFGVEQDVETQGAESL